MGAIPIPGPHRRIGRVRSPIRRLPRFIYGEYGDAEGDGLTNGNEML